MGYSTTVAASIASILAVVLPLFGIQIGTEQLTATIQTIVVVVSGLWIWYQRVNVGDVKWYGSRRYRNK